MAKDRDQDYGDTHYNEDSSDFRQAAPCKSVQLWESHALQHSDGDEGDPRCLQKQI